LKKLVIFCCLVSIFLSGCLLDIVGLYYKVEKGYENGRKVQKDVEDCVQQASEAGLGISKVGTVTRSAYDAQFLDEYAFKRIGEYNLDPDQRAFVEDCLHKKGYFKLF